MTREEFKRFEKADKIITEIDRVSGLIDDFSCAEVEIHIREPYRKDYYFTNKTPLGAAVLSRMKEGMENYVKILKDEFERL